MKYQYRQGIPEYAMHLQSDIEEMLAGGAIDTLAAESIGGIVYWVKMLTELQSTDDGHCFEMESGPAIEAIMRCARTLKTIHREAIKGEE
jgi:hypothetical protein